MSALLTDPYFEADGRKKEGRKGKIIIKISILVYPTDERRGEEGSVTFGIQPPIS